MSQEEQAVKCSDCNPSWWIGAWLIEEGKEIFPDIPSSGLAIISYRERTLYVPVMCPHRVTLNSLIKSSLSHIHAAYPELRDIYPVRKSRDGILEPVLPLEPCFTLEEKGLPLHNGLTLAQIGFKHGGRKRLYMWSFPGESLEWESYYRELFQKALVEFRRYHKH